MHKVFVSYYHKDDQWYKETLVAWAEKHDVFIDGSVDTGDIPEDWDDEKIREEIRDEYLRDTTVTIVLVGKHTKGRKHVDWEIYSSMYDGKKNKKSGIVVIMLPETKNDYVHAGHTGEQKEVFDYVSNWTTISEEEYDERYPDMPKRLLDNIKKGVEISVIPWNKITKDRLGLLIDNAYKDRESCKYDLSERMRRKNSPED